MNQLNGITHMSKLKISFLPKTQTTAAIAMKQIDKRIILVLLLVHYSITAAANTIITDEYALRAFKSRVTFDPNNLLRTSWTNVNHVCNWTGVTCGSRHERIIGMDVSNMDLDGSIPPELGNLSFLSFVDLSGNNFRGNLPAEMARLRRLMYINLSFNNFTGDIPSCFRSFARLQFLNIRNNSFTGFIPGSLFNISKLQKLILSSNPLQGRIPGEMANLHELNQLEMEYNQLTDSIPLALFNISTLESLSFKGNKLSGNLPVDLCHHLPKMKSLRLSHNKLSGELPSSLSQCFGLEILSLTYNNFEGYIPKEIRNLTRLEVLYLGRNNFKGIIPSEIADLSSLKELSMGGNQFEGYVPRELGNLTMLTMLELSQNKLTGLIPEEIGNLHNMKYLNMESNDLSGTLPQSICDRHLKLQKIYLDGNRLSGQLPKKFHKCLELEALQLYQNEFDGRIPREIGNVTTLKTLNLGGNKFTGEVPQEVTDLHMLETLSFEDNMLTGLIPVGIFNMSTLQYIALHYNNLSGDLPSNICEGLPNLEDLYLLNNNLEGLIPSAISNCSRLAFLNLRNNKFSGPIPNSLGDLRLLQRLHLANNSFTSETTELSIITSLTNCKLLNGLDLGDNPLNCALPMSIANLSASVERFHAYNCGIKGNIPYGIGNLSNLLILELRDNYLTGTVPAAFNGLQMLQGLSVDNNLLSGSFPVSICHLKNLNLLYLGRNVFSGSIPICIGNVTPLQYLYIYSNKINSSIPASLWNLKNLLELDLSSNFLTGSLPQEIQNLKAAVTIDLSANSLSGSIPSSIGGLQGLSSLSLPQNGLQGSIPESMGDMLNLDFLDLSQNHLSGSIPISMEALVYLKRLNLSFNNLMGEIPSGGPFKNFTGESFVFNDGLCGDPKFLVSPCSTSREHKRTRKKVLEGIFIALGIAVAMLLLTFGSLFLRKKRRKNVSHATDLLRAGVPKRIPYYELLKATGGYDESNLLGRGSFGSVYQGTLRDGKLVAVKVFNLQLETALHGFEAECQVLRNLRHKNLIKVIGSCSKFDFKALVLEYMPNGSLEKWLYSYNYFLDIMQRLNIMIDVARALEYLHHGHPVPVIHCDLKPSNVLLDEDMVARVTDFSIARLLVEDSTAYTNTLASFGYMAPEYGSTGLVSTKCDVYSFGILLMETFTRRRPNDEMFSENLSIKNWIQESVENEIVLVVDDNLLKPRDKLFGRELECVSSILELALCCTAESSKERLDAKDVHTALEKIKLQFLSLGGN